MGLLGKCIHAYWVGKRVVAMLEKNMKREANVGKNPSNFSYQTIANYSENKI